eukprot:6186093-Pleurochrysis_carterae.AAC.5
MCGNVAWPQLTLSCKNLARQTYAEDQNDHVFTQESVTEYSLMRSQVQRSNACKKVKRALQRGQHETLTTYKPVLRRDTGLYVANYLTRAFLKQSACLYVAKFLTQWPF